MAIIDSLKLETLSTDGSGFASIDGDFASSLVAQNQSFGSIDIGGLNSALSQLGGGAVSPAMSEYDYYAEAKIIAGRIEASGFDERAANIRNVIDAGVSGTETFMKLRFFLAPLVEETSIDELTQIRVKTLIGKIDAALRV